MKRRHFITAAAVAPLAGVAQAKQPDPNEKLLELINRLDNTEGWETASVAWCKAWVADEIRATMGIDAIESTDSKLHIQQQQRDLAHEQRRLAEFARFEELRAKS